MTVDLGLFADTAFWVALSSRRDEHHRRAVLWSRHVSRKGATIHTTEAVLWEWLNSMSHSDTRGLVAVGYRRCHLDPMVDVVALTDPLRDAAIGLYERRSDKGWSLTDCLSFVVMGQREIGDALSTDRHFQQAGFRPVLLGDPPPE